MLDTVVISGEYVCCSVVFDTLVGVVVFGVMWSELLMTSAISCRLWSSVYTCQRVECVFTSPLADIANPDFLGCCCRTWISLDIGCFYEEQCQPSSGSAWPAFQKTVNQAHIAEGRRG